MSRQKVLLRLNGEDLQVENRYALVPVMAPHLHVLEHPGGKGGPAYGTGGAVEHRTVAPTSALESPPFHNSREPPSLRLSRDVHVFPRLEDVDTDFLADLQGGIGIDAKLPERTERSLPRLLDMAEHRLADTMRLLRTEPELNRVVPVVLPRFSLHNGAGARLDHRDGDDSPLRIEDLGHSQFLPYDSGCHGRTFSGTLLFLSSRKKECPRCPPR
jgi:hypothetical protein